jgi:hypothetical protein
MLSIATNWTMRGVDGFYLPYIDYFARTADGSRPDLEKIYPFLASVRDAVDSANRTTPILLYSAVDIDHAVRESLTELGGLNYILNTDLIFTDDKCTQTQAATCIYNKLDESKRHREQYNESYPMWEVGWACVS